LTIPFSLITFLGKTFLISKGQNKGEILGSSRHNPSPVLKIASSSTLFGDLHALCVQKTYCRKITVSTLGRYGMNSNKNAYKIRAWESNHLVKSIQKSPHMTQCLGKAHLHFTVANDV